MTKSRIKSVAFRVLWQMLRVAESGRKPEVMTFTADVVQHDTRTLSLNLNISGLELRGQIRAQDLTFKLGEEGGQITGAEVEVENFEVRSGDLLAQAESLSGKGVSIGWGDAGLRIAAESLTGPSLSLALSSGRLLVGQWSIGGLSVHDGMIELAVGALSRLDVRFEFEAEQGPSLKEDPAQKVGDGGLSSGLSSTKIFDYHLLDGLQGEFNVDLKVDLTVPVIGRRRATHRFRVPIDAGAVDYMQLEKDLSTLENSILDFAVRSDGTLVLERGIPLLPTRGRGKPILTWQLGPDDLALAQKNRIRLAIFPHFEVAGGPASDGETESKSESSSSLALRSLVLAGIEARLILAESPEPLDAAIRSLAIEILSLSGKVQYHPGQEQEPGRLFGDLKGLSTSLVELPLGDHALSVANLHLGLLSDFQGEFLGLAPTSLSCVCGDLSMQGLIWSSSQT